MSKVIDIPKGYKHTKVGVIPVEWSITTLAKLGEFLKGKGISKSEVIDAGNPAIRYGEIYTKHNFFIKEFKSFINNESAHNSRQIEQGDLLFAGSGESIEDIGKCVAYTRNEIAYAGGDIIILRTTNQDVKFLGFLLNHTAFRQQTYKLGQGNSVVHIYSSSLKKIKVAIPSLPEQQKITTILSTWDRAIGDTQLIIDELKLRNKGLAQQLLKGKKRLKGFDGEWRWLRADNIFKNHTDKSHNGDFEVLSATQERGVIPRSMNNIDIKFDKSSLGTYKKVEVGDYVISLRSFQGGIEYSNYEGLVSPAYTVLKEILPISKTYYKIYFKTETFINRLNTIIYGIRDGKQISYKDFSTLKLPYPLLEEQNAISKILEEAGQELKLYEKKLASLKEQKKGLMQKLLTGKIRVKTD